MDIKADCSAKAILTRLGSRVGPPPGRPPRVIFAKLRDMRPVAVIGAGKTAFGAFPNRDFRSLAVEAGEKCLHNAHVVPSQIESFYLGNFAGPACARRSSC